MKKKNMMFLCALAVVPVLSAKCVFGAGRVNIDTEPAGNIINAFGGWESIVRVVQNPASFIAIAPNNITRAASRQYVAGNRNWIVRCMDEVQQNGTSEQKAQLQGGLRQQIINLL